MAIKLPDQHRTEEQSVLSTTNTILAVVFALSTVIQPAIARGADVAPISGPIEKELVSFEQSTTKVKRKKPVGWLGLINLLRF